MSGCEPENVRRSEKEDGGYTISYTRSKAVDTVSKS